MTADRRNKIIEILAKYYLPPIKSMRDIQAMNTWCGNTADEIIALPVDGYYPKEFIEWLYFGGTNFYSVPEKHKWYNGWEDCYMTTDELYYYWLKEIKK